MSRRRGRSTQLIMQRRPVLRGVVVFGAAFLGLLPSLGQARPSAGFRQCLIESAQELVHDQEAARAIWQAYRAAHGRESQRVIILELREVFPNVGEEHSDEIRSSLKASLKRTIRSDFAEGRVLELDGWILSRTEVGLCALASGARVS